MIRALLKCEYVPVLLDEIREGFSHILHLDSHVSQLLRDTVGICASLARLLFDAVLQHRFYFGLQA